MILPISFSATPRTTLRMPSRLAGHWDNESWALYIQDNYRVNNRLTLNLGLRWDGIPHTYEETNQMANFYPNLYSAANAATFAASDTTDNTIDSS